MSGRVEGLAMPFKHRPQLPLWACTLRSCSARHSTLTNVMPRTPPQRSHVRPRNIRWPSIESMGHGPWAKCFSRGGSHDHATMSGIVLRCTRCLQQSEKGQGPELRAASICTTRSRPFNGPKGSSCHTPHRRPARVILGPSLDCCPHLPAVQFCLCWVTSEIRTFRSSWSLLPRRS
jgi:hypothetical protein